MGQSNRHLDGGCRRGLLGHDYVGRSHRGNCSANAGALSFMPGGLGGTEVTMIVSMKLFATPLPIAVSATLVIQVATLWFAVLLGIIALSIRAKIPQLPSTVCT
jgi:hypothetical protein